MPPGGWKVTGVPEGGSYCQIGRPAVKIERQQSTLHGAHNLPCQSWGQTWSGDLVSCHPSGPLVTPCLPHEDHGG